MLDAEMISHLQFEFSFRAAKVAVPIMQVVCNFHPHLQKNQIRAYHITGQ
jgi:hypothetical protein